MNKVKIGLFLRTLRKEKGISIEKLSEKFLKDYLNVSVNAISSWENGKTIPSIDNLEFLANYFGVTMNEILDGERYTKKDFDKTYYLSRNIGLADLWEIFGEDVSRFDATTNRARLIKTNFKKLLTKLFKKEINHEEMDELRYLVKNGYILDSEYSETKYFQFLQREAGFDKTIQEKIWDALTLVTPVVDLGLSFRQISDGDILNESAKKRIDILEDWEKDKLLAVIQNYNPITIGDDIAHSRFKSILIKRTGKADIELEQVTKDTIKTLIECGAVINDAYLSRDIEIKTEASIIDRLEELYEEFEKPIEIAVDSDDGTNIYNVENNPINRLLAYDQIFVSEMEDLGFSIEHTLELIMKNTNVPDKVYQAIAKKYQQETEHTKKDLKATIYGKTHAIEYSWKEVRVRESKALKYEEEKNELVEMLKNGVYTIINTTYFNPSKLNVDAMESEINSIRAKQSYKEFCESRLFDKTKQLLDEIDNLTVEQIRQKYFFREAITNEQRN